MRTNQLYLASIFLVVTALGVAQNYPFRNIGTDKGFDAGTSYHLLQDRKGYIWVSSKGNLYKYNGRVLKGYNDDNSMFSNRNIFGAFEDNTGRLFYFPADARMGYVKNDSCFIPPFGDSLASLFKGARLFVLDMEQYDDTHLVLGTQNGFYLVSSTNLDGLTYVPAPDTISLWIRIFNGKALGSVYSEKLRSGRTANMMVSIGAKNIVIPMEFYGGPAPGMFSFDCVALHDGRVLIGFPDRLVIVYPDGKYSFLKIEKRLIELYADKDEGLWLGYYKGGADYFKDAALNNKPETMLDGLSVTSFLKDNEGGIWVTTEEENVLYCPSLAVMNYSNHNDIGKTGMGLSKVGNKVLTGNTTGKTYIFSEKHNYQVRDFSGIGEMGGVYVFTKHHNRIYAAGYGACFVLDTNFKFLDYLYNDKKVAGHLYTIISTKNYGPVGLSYDRCWFIRGNELFPGPRLDSRARDMNCDTTGRIYIGTVNGLFLYEGDTLKAVKEVPYTIVRIQCFSDSKIWVTTERDGILLMEGTKILKRYQSPQGFLSRAYNDISIDGRGNKWIASDKGLFCLGADEKVHVYNSHDGLPTDMITRVLVNGNDMFLRSPKGLCVADLSLLKPNLAAPKLYIDSILYNGSRTFESRFGHKRGNFTFFVSGLSYFNPLGVKYRYRVEGLDTAWQTNSTGEIILGNMDHGLYRIEIYALSANNIRSNTVSYTFTVDTPFWMTWWFFLLEVIAVCGLVYLLVRWRTTEVKKKEVEKTAVNKMIAEHQMSALRAQMNPHFLFNAISSIQRYILKKDQQEAYDYLAKFSKLIRIVLDNSEQKVLMLGQELDMIRLYVEMEQMRFNSSFDFRISKEAHINEYETPIPAIILQPYVENAIWHGLMNLEKDKKGVLTLSVSTVKDLLKIVIEDNGVGRDKTRGYKKNDAHKPLGMRVTQERLNVINKIQEYGTARVEIVDLKDESGNALGTRVEIYLPVSRM